MLGNLNELLKLAENRGTKKVAIAAADDIYVMKAITRAKELGLITPIYIGDYKKIKQTALSMKVAISDNEIIDCPDADQACITAVKMAHEGKADLIMKGLVSTGILLKHVVSKEYGLLSDKILSHLALFESPNYHKLLGLSDAAMLISPGIKEKKSIITNAVEAFHKIGLAKPKVALLAAVEKVNPKIPATTDAVELKKYANEGLLGECFVDGPFALDIAISKEAAHHKGISGPVAGDADMLVAPDLNSGNILYKSLSFLGNAKCAAIITGSSAPIILTSRADTEETKFLSIALGVLTSI